MFDYGERLRLEPLRHGIDNSIETLESLVNCYLVALSSLSLVEPEHAWLYFRPPHSYEISRKRRRDGQQATTEPEPEGKTYELADVQKSYLLALARLHLVKYAKSPERVGMSLSMVVFASRCGTD